MASRRVPIPDAGLDQSADSDQKSGAAPHGGRIRIALSCSVCGKRNYRSTKSPRDGGTLSLKKFCNQCGQHTAHIEGK